jgi:hypothetical protein
MAKTTARQTFQRRTFDLHVAALLQLRRQHGHHSFFDDRGNVREYAQDYLLAWLAPELSEQAGEIRRLHIDASADATLEEGVEQAVMSPAAILVKAAPGGCSCRARTVHTG